MDINEILNSLGIDLTNPEAKRGAIEAIQAILDSRIPPPDMSGGAGGIAPPEKEIDVDLEDFEETINTCYEKAKSIVEKKVKLIEKLAKVLGPGKTVVTVLPDTAERYFSTPLFENE